MSFCMHTDDVTCPYCAPQRGEYHYWPYEPRTVGALPVPKLTEADVRRIVREELENEYIARQGKDEVRSQLRRWFASVTARIQREAGG